MDYRARLTPRAGSVLCPASPRPAGSVRVVCEHEVDADVLAEQASEGMATVFVTSDRGLGVELQAAGFAVMRSNVLVSLVADVLGEGGEARGRARRATVCRRVQHRRAR